MKTRIFIVHVLLLLVCCTHALAQGMPQLAFVYKDTAYDFGGVPMGITVTYGFEIRNTGDAPLTVSGMVSESPNMKFKWPTKAIKPGKKGLLSVTYTAKGEIGSFKNDVSVTSNSAVPVQIHISGAITPATSDYMPPLNKQGKNQIKVESRPDPGYLNE